MKIYQEYRLTCFEFLTILAHCRPKRLLNFLFVFWAKSLSFGEKKLPRYSHLFSIRSPNSMNWENNWRTRNGCVWTDSKWTNQLSLWKWSHTTGMKVNAEKWEFCWNGSFAELGNLLNLDERFNAPVGKHGWLNSTGRRKTPTNIYA